MKEVWERRWRGMRKGDREGKAANKKCVLKVVTTMGC